MFFERYSDGLPKPHSNDPTQWQGRLVASETPLQVAVAYPCRCLWPCQTGFMYCPAVGPDGLEKRANEDGVVRFAALKGEAPARERLAALLSDAFGARWPAAKLASLLVDVVFAGKTFDDWLRDGFFAQHCTSFHHRPFVRHIRDGGRDRFQVLVNCLAGLDGEGRRTLEKLVYLGDWVDRQRAEREAEIEGADVRLARAEHLRAELVKIIEGEQPDGIFVRRKPLDTQPGEPEVNDSVRVNIRPFAHARPLGARAKNACVLSAAPNVDWNKDRDKGPRRDNADCPWFWSRNANNPAHAVDFRGGAAFDGNRWNDLHYTRAFKEAARTQAAEGASR